MASSLFILRSEQIKLLVEEKQLPEASLNIAYESLPQQQQQSVDDAMPFVIGFEVDGGGDRNVMHLQNFLAIIAFVSVAKCDKLVVYRSAAGHLYLYLNTIERAISIINIGLANHTTCLDPDSPQFLLDILSNCGSMKQLRNVLVDYDSVLVEALKFLHRVEERRAMAVGTVNDAGNDSACG